MKKTLTFRQASLVIAGVLLAGGLLLGALAAPGDGYSFPAPLKTTDVGTTDLSDKAIVPDETFRVGHLLSGSATTFADRQMEIDETFTSNLPIVVLDTDGMRPPLYAYFDPDLQHTVWLDDVEPYIEGQISLIDSKKGVNSLTDTPSIISYLRMRRRGNSSGHYDKHQYLVKLTDENGHANRQSFLGMGNDNEWILNVSFIDKSLLRNYLAYKAAGELMPYTPDAEFCELVWKDGDTYQYEGVYLLMESVKVGRNRVNLPAFSENAQYLPALLRRDRINEEAVMLNNYATREDLLYGYLEVKWPEESALTQESIDRITAQIDAFEEALFAEDYEDFLAYREYVDLDSFVDYFVLNEFFVNYDAGNNSTYMYIDYSGKIHMGPVWDYDGAMDNYSMESADYASTAFQNAPWFRQMLRDPEFTRLIVERYHELRQSILSDESIQAFIDGTVEGLGSAIERDWARWGYYYIHGKHLREEYPGQPDRNTRTHAEEVEKLKTVLSEHGAWLDRHSDSLYQFAEPGVRAGTETAESPRNWGSALAVVFVAAFFVSLQLLKRVEQEE